LTTAFYDVLRQQSPTFYDYPHHFAFLDVNDDGVSTAGRRVQLDLAAVGSPWGALDVWPESNWIVASGTVDGMLKKVFDWQINHLFWPEAFMPGPRAAALPDYVRKLLAARLKTVYYYNTACPTLELRVSPRWKRCGNAASDGCPRCQTTSLLRRGRPRRRPTCASPTSGAIDRCVYRIF
jgi:hypothetical protein